jgi:energy-converting hydrogenase A subunit M
LIPIQWRIYGGGSRGTGPSPELLQKIKINNNSYIFAELAMLNIHREVEITVDEVIEELAKKSRQLEFIL